MTMEYLMMEIMATPGAGAAAASIPADADTMALAEKHRRHYGHHDGEALCLAIEHHVRLTAVAGDYCSPALTYIERTIAAGAPAWEL